MSDTLSRRDFIKASAGGLLLAFLLPMGATAQPATEGATQPFVPNAFVRIGTDDVITVLVPKSEMGQGVLTSLPTIVAEELDADIHQIRPQEAPADKAYIVPGIGLQFTGGSTSVRTMYEGLRYAGATARAMLVTAAAQVWNVRADTLTTEKGHVLHAATGRRIAYGQLAARAANVPVPHGVKLKTQFRYIGHPVPRFDVADKTCGKTVFGIDVRVPGMLYAAILRCPTFGGKVKSVDDSKTRAISGVRKVVNLEYGVGVVADHYWTARKGLQALNVVWDEGPKLDQAGIWKMLETHAADPGAVASTRGNIETSLAHSARRLKAVYRLPYLAHSTMEPLNATAQVHENGVDVWAPTQAQTLVQYTASKIAGCPPDNVTVHTTFLGGGFGRKFEQDFIADAVSLAKAAGAPVQVIWSREDDTQHDFYRPIAYHVMEAGLDAHGGLAGWKHKIVSQSIMSRVFPDRVQNGVDATTVEGAFNHPYDAVASEVRCVHVDTGVPVGFWRSVGSSHNAFAVESFIDEVAHAAGQDPYHYRRGLLKHAPRHLAALDLAAKNAGWGAPLPKGRYRGIAVAESFGSFVAQVAEITVQKGQPHVERVVVGVDCGPIVNPDIIRQQMEGGVVFGLTAAYYGNITLKDGRVEQGNFDSYPMLRMKDAPLVETHVVPSMEKMGGIGEPGVPPIAPAVANAFFAATGKRVRELPLMS